MSHSLRSAVTWVMAERGWQMGVALLVGIMLARSYGPAGFATYQGYVSLAAVFSSVGFLCSAEVLMPRYRSNDPTYSRIFELAFFIRLVLSATATLAYLAWVRWEFSDNIWLALGFLPIVLIQEPFAVFGTYFQTLGQAVVWSRIRLGWMAVRAAGIATVVWAGLPLGWVGLPYVLEGIGVAVFLAYRYRRARGPRTWGWDKELGRELLFHGSMMGVGLIAAAVLQRLDRLHLAAQGELELMGPYAAGIQITEAWFYCAFFLVQAVVGPYIYRQSSQLQRRRIWQVAGLFVLVALLAWAVTYVLAPWLVPLLYGAQFAETVSWLRWQVAMAVVVWAEAGLGIAMLARKASLWVSVKWGCALLAAWAVAPLQIGPLPAPLQIPLVGYSVACLFSLVYLLCWKWNRGSAVLPGTKAR